MLEDLNPRVLLPRTLRQMRPAAKTLWLYFNLTGSVVVSQRELSNKLGFTQLSVSQNLNELSSAKLISYKPGQDRSDKSHIKALHPLFSKLEHPFPSALKEADTSAKTLYLWLLPQGVVNYSHKEVSAYLGIAETTAASTRQELESLNAIAYKQRPGPRLRGIYLAVPANELDEPLADVDTSLTIPKEIEEGMAGEMKLYWLITRRGEVTAHQKTLAETLDIPQSSVSKAVNNLIAKGFIERTKREGENVLISMNQNPPSQRLKSRRAFIPQELKGEANAVQFLYLWLEPQGKVSYSYSDIVELVRLRTFSVIKAFLRLEELDFLKVYKKPTPRTKGTFKIV
jgi:Mn-dependent DtxR family transcriptional regulator